MTEPTFAIVGGGLAGAKAAETLREEGFDGRLVLFGAEAERPYERPPLSKEYLRSESTEKPFVHPAEFYAEADIELRTSARVTAIDAENSRLVGEDGSTLSYERLLIATGARPRRLDVPGSDLDGIHYLRSIEDSEWIGGLIGPGKRVVVVGSGWIGGEIAASAIQKGCTVTMIEMGSLPLERVLGEDLGRIYLALHRENGVEFLPETTVERFEGDRKVERVLTRDGAIVDCDIVVVGIGVKPRVELAATAGIRTENGILVDAGLETSVSGIFAAGDVANVERPFFGKRIRVEHWANALGQGLAAAKSMLGQPVSYDEIPYFFSDQYDAGMEYGGYATEWDRIVFRGDVAAREFVAFWLDDDRVVAGLNMNVWDVNEQIRDLVRSRNQVDPRRLEDPDVPLPDLVPTGAATGSERGQ